MRVKGHPLIYPNFYLLIPLSLSLSHSLSTTPVLSLYSVCSYQDSNWPWLHKSVTSKITATFIHESSESNNSSHFIIMWMHMLSFETWIKHLYPKPFWISLSDKQIEMTFTHAAQSLMDDDITSATIQTCTCECAAIWFHPRWVLGLLLAKFVFAF